MLAKYSDEVVYLAECPTSVSIPEPVKYGKCYQ